MGVVEIEHDEQCDVCDDYCFYLAVVDDVFVCYDCAEDDETRAAIQSHSCEVDQRLRDGCREPFKKETT